MRTKLSELISTIDQYNGIGEYTDKNEYDDQFAVDSEIEDCPGQATLSENRTRQLIHNILNEDKPNSTSHQPECYVKSFETFISEQKGTPSNVQSYMGELDDEDDWEEE